jgi:hypothetical protein
MKTFLQNFGHYVIGVLSGFDRFQASGMPSLSVSTGAVPPANAPVGFLCSATRRRVTEPNRWLLSRQASSSPGCRNR